MLTLNLKKILFSFSFFIFFTPSLFAVQFSAEKDYLIKEGAPFIVKGVVYVPAYPGTLPWTLAVQSEISPELQRRIQLDLEAIQAMGANTIRLWDAPLFLYQALQKSPGLAILQTLWLEVQAADLQNKAFKESSKRKIAKVIDRIHAAYGNEEPPILAYLVGNELSARTIQQTDNQHPEIKSYKGTFISAPEGSTASECFLAEMADYVKVYEQAKYGRTHLISYANDLRTYEIIDTPFLDFRSFNLYVNSLRDYASPKNGTVTGTEFQGMIETLKSKVPDKPLLVTESGLSVSPKAERYGPPDYGYGGNSEQDQADALHQIWKDVTTAQPPGAGLCVHEFLDAWWKFGLKDSLEHEPEDVEEWFGLTAVEKRGSAYEAVFRPAYFKLKELWQEK